MLKLLCKHRNRNRKHSLLAGTHSPTCTMYVWWREGEREREREREGERERESEQREAREEER